MVKFNQAVIRFSEARLVCLQAASYIELSKPHTSPASMTVKCCYCPKTTIHEHSIIGKVKFDPRAQNFLVSLVPSVATQDASPKPKGVKTSPTLQIVPLPASSDPPKRPEPDPGSGSKRAKLFPEVFSSEKEVCKSFATELADYLDRQEDKSDKPPSSFMRAAKESDKNLIHVIKSSKSDSRSVLKFSARNSPCSDCAECRSKSFETLPDLKRHFEGRHHCSVTIKSLSSEPKEATAVKTSERVTKQPTSSGLSCDACSASFEADVDLIRHKNDAHAGKADVKFQCEKCLQFFKSSNSFKKHLSEFHKKSKLPRNHVCNLCQKRFLKVQHLNDHVNRHFGAKPHQCNLCDKKYTSQFSLKSHKINSHGIGEKPSCDICDKSFFNRTLLNRHILEKHKKDSRLECQHCGHVYLRKNNLDAHIKSAHPAGSTETVTAASVQPKCQLCSKTYSSKGSLTDHLRICHGILPWNVLPMAKNGQDLDVECLEKELAGSVQCKFCEQTFLPTEMESHLRFSHGVMPVRPGGPTERSITEAAEALLRTLTPQPDYLLRCLTPLPMETLDEIIMKSALNKD